ECVRLCVKYGFVLIGVASILLVIFAKQLVSVFTNDLEVIRVGTTYIRIVSVMQWAYVMTFIHIGFLQALKRPFYGFVESIIRKIVLPLSIFPLLVLSHKVSLVGFWWGMVAINITMTVVTIIYAHQKLKQVEKESS
ncbi:MAG: MATE family efflux transporter, partial [Akkermansiaceae bacterium]